MGIAGIKSLLHSSHIFLVLNTKTNSRQKYSSPSHILSLYFDLKFPLYLSREHLEQSHRKQIRKYITLGNAITKNEGGPGQGACANVNSVDSALFPFWFVIAPLRCVLGFFYSESDSSCVNVTGTQFFFISEVSRRVS